MVKIRIVSTEEETIEAKKILQEYADWLDLDMCYGNIAKEIKEFPGEYGPPGGKFYLAYEGMEVVGSVALRMWKGDICEMKRLFVRPVHRSKGLGRILARFIVDEARKMGYKRMRLDTLPHMVAAITLYKSLGFREITKYRISPTDDAVYFELDIAS